MHHLPRTDHRDALRLGVGAGPQELARASAGGRGHQRQPPEGVPGRAGTGAGIRRRARGRRAAARGTAGSSAGGLRPHRPRLLPLLPQPSATLPSAAPLRGRGQGAGRARNRRAAQGAVSRPHREPLLREAVVHRQPAVALALGPQVANPREGDVVHRHEVALLRGIGVSLRALGRRRLGINIILDGHRGLGELDRGHVHQVAPEHELLPLALRDVEGVAGGVAQRFERPEAGRQFRAPLESFELSRRDVRRQRGHRVLEGGLVVVRSLLRVRGRQPVVRLALVRVHGGVREHGLARHHQTARVVAMDMGEQHRVDLLGLIARRPQVADEPPRRRSEQLPRPRVHQEQLGARVDEVGVDGHLHRRGEVRVGEQRADVLRLGVGEQLLHRLWRRAVGQHGDLEVAQHHPVEAGRLCLDLRGGGVGGSGVPPAQEGGEAGGQRGAAEERADLHGLPPYNDTGRYHVALL
ncbi:hypothetical protein STIAU_8070 [Stigmatella aurantiaca DW4/3-1]|uniref:Uncharacterized protein n=1 Tax=Stigmatella aurantiaca (strain DW4/3-1) TaxID=378806 RepID=Q09BW9_STIAD|nr:hypothetical protein STIAU_8070 [Stigmatella aurantiaca DW4/3-1]